MARNSKRNLRMKELTVGRLEIKRVKREEAMESMDRSTEVDIATILEKIDDSSSEEEDLFMISDNDEPDLEQYIIFILYLPEKVLNWYTMELGLH